MNADYLQAYDTVNNSWQRIRPGPYYTKKRAGGLLRRMDLYPPPKSHGAHDAYSREYDRTGMAVKLLKKFFYD